jgi:copper chaperone NosL
MKNLVLMSCLLLLICCTTRPQPIEVGKDVCSFCKMPVADPKFGAEIITEKGKLYKFDDIGCMNHYLKNGLRENEKIKNIYVVSYAHNQKFSDVNKSFFLNSERIHTPMNSETAAFESQSDAAAFSKDFPGEILSWDQLQSKLK